MINLIYVKDYSALNSFVFEEWPNPAPSYLYDLKGKLVTVFTENGNRATGVLIEILNDSIKLVLKPQSTSNWRCRSFRLGRPVAVVYICIENICAIAFNEY
jgi:hypothetical protein